MDTSWHTSSYSNQQGGHCVEVAESPQVIKVRDTQNRSLGHLTFDRHEWTAFLADLRAGEL